MKFFKQHIDDILFYSGAATLSLGGFLIYIPIGFFILGACLIASAFIIGKVR